jgi:hypothetical protein
MVTRRIYAGAASVTTLSAGVNSTALSIPIDDDTGWPSGGSFYAVIDPETASEEKILCNGRTGTTLSVASASDRGVDGTTAQAHTAGAAVWHTFTSVDADEANSAAVNTVGRITQKGGLLVGTSAATLAELAPGTDGHLLQVDSSTTTGLKHAALPDGAVSSTAKFAASVVNATALAANAVTTAKILDDNVTAAKIADGAIDSADKLASNVVTTAKILDDNVTADKIADGAIDAAAKLASNVVTTAKILDSNVTTAKIADDAVTLDKLSFQMDSGTLSATVGLTSNLDITFTTAFSAAPLVFVQVSDSVAQVANVDFTTAPPTTSGFRVTLYRADTGAPIGAGNPTRISWFAISDLG